MLVPIYKLRACTQLRHLFNLQVADEKGCCVCLSRILKCIDRILCDKWLYSLSCGELNLNTLFAQYLNALHGDLYTHAATVFPYPKGLFFN